MTIYLEAKKALSILASALAILSAISLVVVDFAEARERKGGGSSQRYSNKGGGQRSVNRQRAHPRVSNTQRNRAGNFGGGLKQTRKTRPAAGVSDRSSGRQQTRRDRPGDRQDGRTDRTDIRQGNRTDRQGNRQDGRTDRVGDRQETRRRIADDIADNHYWSNHHHYHDHYHDYWHHDSNDAAWALFGGLVLGAFIASLPPKYETVVVVNKTYFYADGVYYVKSGSQYEVVPAPVGVVVQNPPSQVVNVNVEGAEYGYSNGAYYEVNAPAEKDADPTFEVVAPPIGATVTDLPEGAEKKTVKDQDFFVYAGTWYQPFYSGSNVVYVVAEEPEG